LTPATPRCRAGTPATVAPAGTSRLTTAPAPTIAPAPTLTPPSRIAPEPIVAPSPTVTASCSQSPVPASWPASSVARGRLSLQNITPWPTKTPSPIVTPEQMNVWLWILQRGPTEASAWISTKVPTLLPSPISQP
jgi:hypothetical protein